jgi:hypothetical protein
MILYPEKIVEKNVTIGRMETQSTSKNSTNVIVNGCYYKSKSYNK